MTEVETFEYDIDCPCCGEDFTVYGSKITDSFTGESYTSPTWEDCPTCGEEIDLTDPDIPHRDRSMY